MEEAARSAAASAARTEGLSYGATALEYASLLAKPKLDASMLSPIQSDWEAFYVYWNVIYVDIGLVSLALRFLMRMGYDILTIFNILMLPWDIVTYFLTAVVLCIPGHLAWYCVIKRKGCCGAPGLLAMAAYYVLVPLHSLSESMSHKNSTPLLTAMLLSVPTVALVYACLQLATGASSQSAREVTGQTNMDASLAPHSAASAPASSDRGPAV
eukprot:TRINITY_DN81758_c0_g1_i1.p1 TRINITY_DN81758_c0_g1~~TRINITY_DN81758_c0_g1_i1.p1  ORF type:complete len:224 (+),score=24.82 TRINITY_DN81758_c0_g1_i1:34-672(+)